MRAIESSTGRQVEKSPIEVQDDSLGLNSSNSNIEEEFEQIKSYLQQLSKMSHLYTNQINRQESTNMQEGGEVSEQQYSGGDLSEESAEVERDKSIIQSPKKMLTPSNI